MHKKIAATLLVTSALMLPGLVSAEVTPPMGQIFPNRGACESTLKQARNLLRQEVIREAARPTNQQGQAGALTNRVANPLTKAVCQALTGKDGKTVFKIVEG